MVAVVSELLPPSEDDDSAGMELDPDGLHVIADEAEDAVLDAVDALRWLTS